MKDFGNSIGASRSWISSEESAIASPTTADEGADGVDSWSRVAVLSDVDERFVGAASCTCSEDDDFADFARCGDAGTIVRRQEWDLPWVRMDHSGEEVEVSIGNLVPLDPLALEEHHDEVPVPFFPQSLPHAVVERLTSVDPEKVLEEARLQGFIWALHIGTADEVRMVFQYLLAPTAVAAAEVPWLAVPSVRETLHRFNHTHQCLYWCLAGAPSAREAYQRGFTEGVAKVVRRLMLHQRLGSYDNDVFPRPPFPVEGEPWPGVRRGPVPTPSPGVAPAPSPRVAAPSHPSASGLTPRQDEASIDELEMSDDEAAELLEPDPVFAPEL